MDYFVIMADMRDSTAHLRRDPPSDALVESGLHRLYLETSALLPTLAHHISAREGRVTEYLGDGVLAFFQASEIASSRVYSLGEDCLEVSNSIISAILAQRYGLPAVRIGVGLSVGPAIVTVMGSGNDARPIAFGAPVFEAAKLSKEDNQVIISTNMRDRWPKSSGGKRRFKQVTVRSNDVGFRSWIEE